MAKYIRGEYVKRERPETEALPRTFQKTGHYTHGMGEVPIVYRPGAFNHMAYKSLGSSPAPHTKVA